MAKSEGSSGKDSASNAPDTDAAAQAFAEFCKTVARLRHPQDGCPWDLQQTHESLRRFMIEEAYEAVEAVTKGQAKQICDELGDVLLQVVLNAQLGYDAKTFSIVDVIHAINTKMLRRHPHVFGDDSQKNKSASEVSNQWQKIKEAEKQHAEEPGASRPAKSVFGKVRKDGFPATLQALKIGEIAARIKFDWDNPHAVFEKLLSEIEELQDVLTDEDGENVTPHPAVRRQVEEELGDIYFTLAQLCRHLGFDPESVAIEGNAKFLRRFETVEALASKQGIDIERSSQATLEELWSEAKRQQKKHPQAPFGQARLDEKA